jgi:PmbA protein
VSFSALVSSDDGGSGYAVASGSAPDKIEILPAFRTAYEKARLNTNPLDIEPGAYTVILEPLAVADLLRYLSFGGFSGKGIQNQTSFLTGRLGSKVFDEKLTMIDDHTHEHTRTLPFDFEGTPRQTITLVENGVAKAVVHDTASARKAGTQSTGHSMNMPAFGGIPLHLVVAPGEKTLKEIIESSDDALLVTRFHYMNPVNPRQAQLTGLTRDGFFKVENGRIVAALKNMRFTESMLQAMNDIAAISSDRQQVGGYYVPAMKIRNFHFTGKASL